MLQSLRVLRSIVDIPEDTRLATLLPSLEELKGAVAACVGLLVARTQPDLLDVLAGTNGMPLSLDIQKDYVSHYVSARILAFSQLACFFRRIAELDYDDVGDDLEAGLVRFFWFR